MHSEYARRHLLRYLVTDKHAETLQTYVENSGLSGLTDLRTLIGAMQPDADQQLYSL